MTTTTTDGLIAHAHEYGICVYWRPLARGGRGLWDARTRSIWIDPYLTSRATRSLLAHEIGHAALGHRGPQGERGEAAAWEWGACLLLDHYTYAAAERVYGGDLGTLADVLDVTRELLQGFQRTIDRKAA